MNQTSLRIIIWSISASILLPSLVLWHGLNPVLALVISVLVVGLPVATLRKKPRLNLRLAVLSALVFGLYGIAYLGIWQYGICRMEVPAGNSLLLRYKGPFPFGTAPMAAEGTLSKADERGHATEIGILEFMPGPGRHFYNPIEYERKIVPDVVISPNEIGVVTSKIGKNLPEGEILANEPGFRGTWRQVLTPGRYRMNPYAYEVNKVAKTTAVVLAEGLTAKPEDPTLIMPGYVGVVYNKVGDNNPGNPQKQGVQDNVLQPGLYWINPAEKRVDIISIGFNETTLMVKTAGQTGLRPPLATAKDGMVMEPDPIYVEGEGIEFPSNDGFRIHLDFTAIWGILPEQAPDVVRNFGTLTDIRKKVIEPQIGSICRINGSKRGAVDLLVGNSREEFQSDVEDELERVLKGKNLSLLFGLTRHIYVPAEVREPIQRSYIATELKITREQEQKTAKAKADLTEAEAKVVLEERRTKAETQKMMAETTAKGEKEAKEIEAETQKLSAVIDAKTATVQAQITKLMGAAEAKKVQLANEAEAEIYKLSVDALGSPEAYNRFIFAEGLPEQIRMGVFYAGPGTLWTDLKNLDQAFLGKMAAESDKPKTESTKPALPMTKPAILPATGTIGNK
ncbi:MAG: SPFH domain-containing protein [bacterium]